jgi:hypothetical protein
MFKVKIKRLSDNAYTHSGTFQSQEEAQAWIEKCESLPSKPWGTKAGEKTVENEDGSFSVIQVAATYEIEIENISTQIADAEIAEHKKNQAKNAIKNLDLTDLTGSGDLTPKQMSTILKAILPQLVELYK